MISPIGKKLRREILEASYKAKACHIGSALSCVDIIWEIYQKMRADDKFLFSKASGAAAFYAVLSELEWFEKDKMVPYLKKHPLPNTEVPGVWLDGGSLGHGLPIACGMALADRTRDIYILMSDGELQEGTTYESLLFKRQHKLDNLKIYADCNGLQACGKVKDILALPDRFLKEYGVNMVKTVKGSGVSFMENNNDWHYKNLDENTYQKAICELAD